MDNNLSATALSLVRVGLLDMGKAFDIQISAHKAELDFIEYICKHSILSGRLIGEQLAKYFNYQFLNLNYADICLTMRHNFSENFVKKFKVLPLSVKSKKLYLATANPCQHEVFLQIKFHVGFEIVPVVVEHPKLQACIDRYLTNNQNLKFKNKDESLATQPVVKYVNSLLTKAIAKNSSDIHFEPDNNTYQIRLRLDGILHKFATDENLSAMEVCARIKVLANLNIVEKRLPQDGSFIFKLPNNGSVDCRVSICPTVRGEKVVIRFLNQANKHQFKVNDLCLGERDYTVFIQALSSPQGLILVSGPTGSGKSTTLYTALKYLNNDTVNIVSVEDPVEVQIPGINQMQVSAQLGFAKVLRAVLRQDPDIIMLGEIRDLETAQIAVQAAQTGHLVLASIHTNSAVQTLSRLVSLGVPIYNLLESLRMIIAQRLLRKLCLNCRKLQLDYEGIKIAADSKIFCNGYGCCECNNGYMGRKAIFEVMSINTEIKTYLQSASCSENGIESLACKQGMRLLKDAGLAEVIAGNTSYEELQRVCEI